MVPPPTLIPKVIKKNRGVVSNWKTSPYCPLVFEGEHIKTLISHWSYLPYGHVLSYVKITTHDKSTNSVFAEFPRKSQMLASRIDFELS